MKKNILVFCTALFFGSLTAYGYFTWNDLKTTPAKPSCLSTASLGYDLVNRLTQVAELDLVYNVDSRFIHHVTKSQVDNASSILDLLPEKATETVVSYKEVQVQVLHENGETIEKGLEPVLTPAQQKLLRSTDYSSNIVIKAYFSEKKPHSDELTGNYLSYYMTIVPEKEATYTGGNDALIAYLKEGTKMQTAIITEDKLQPGQVFFTVTKKGTISDVKINSSSGYPSIDELSVELIKNTSGTWSPATNLKGKKVDQELVFFFGREGC